MPFSLAEEPGQVVEAPRAAWPRRMRLEVGHQERRTDALAGRVGQHEATRPGPRGRKS